MAGNHPYNLYRYKCYDLLSNKYLGDIPLVNVTFTNMLNDAGGFTGTMPLVAGNTQVGKLQRALVSNDLIGMTSPGAVALYVERSDYPGGANKQLIWGGIIWTRTKQLNYQTQVNIGAKEFFSYFDQRFIGGAYSSSLYYVNADEVFIATDIINKMQSIPHGNIGIAVPTPSPSGQTLTSTYYNYQFTKSSQAIRDLSALTNGFDFTVNVGYGANGLPAPIFNTYYPQKGLMYNNTPLVISRPGSIMDYTWPEDGTTTANVATAVGAGTGTAMIFAIASNVNLAGNLPVLEAVNSYKQETVQANISARATSDLAILQNPVVIPNVVLQANADPRVGTYSVGDIFLLKIADSRFSTPLAQYYRIISITTQPQDNGINEQVTLTLSQNLTV